MRLIAHRGASGRAPENTMAAFRLALELKAAAVELDVHQTADGRLAVIHDWDLKRVSGRRARVGRMSWDELGGADVGAWFSEEFRGERVPELEQVLELAQGRMEVHIELKAGSRKYPGIEDRTADLLERRRAWGWVMVSSFDHDSLFRMRGLCSRARLGYLLGLSPMKRAWAEMEAIGAESLNLSLRQASARRVASGRRRGYRVFVYTVNTPAAAKKMERLGVDGVYTNFPDMAFS